MSSSVLWLLQEPTPYAENIARHAKPWRGAGAHPVAPNRPRSASGATVFVRPVLDSLPYNAHTTGSDALWAGVPLLTRRGTASGRVAVSLLMRRPGTGDGKRRRL
jgi:predicted O-linked N-acetylglucosamine transferase (SPINDLY family)